MESVNNPSHYTSGEIQAIDAMRSAFGSDELKMFCKINAFKYIWRSSLHKDGDDINISKAIWFLRMYLDDDPRQKNPKT